MALPTPITQTEVRHSGGFIISEDRGGLSRDMVTFVNSGTADIELIAGTVLAFADEGASAEYTLAAAGAGAGGANTGGGSVGSVTFGAQAQPGVYTVRMTAATVFTITDPKGDVLTVTGATGTAFLDAQIGLTVTASGAAFIAGDGFTITVPAELSRLNTINATLVTPGGSNTGNGTLGSLAFGSVFKTGTYKVTFSSATAFSVTDPSGTSLGSGTVGTAFTSTPIGFLITAGGTAFANNDTFSISVPAGDAHFVNWTNSSPATAIAFNTEWIRAGQYKNVTVVARFAQVNAAELVWDSSITGASNPAQLYDLAYQQLALAGIVAR
jgi:hypothetical protein